MSDTNSYMEKLDGMSLNVEQAEIEKLRTVFPQCFAEGRLDLTKLLALLGEYDDNDFEKYKFEWKGKAESLRLAQTRSMGTLRPSPTESVDWETTGNVYIEGDNLEVLKLLQKAYSRRVKMIYIDPPYNTGNDFVYNDDFADPLSRYKEITSQMTKSNPEVAGRYHTNWLNMMYPRLRLAANLLSDDGVIFISIDDNEVHNLRKVCDEVFGEENFVAQIIWERAYAPINLKKHFSTSHDFILCYAKSLEQLVCNGIARNEEADNRYQNHDNDPRGVWKPSDMSVGPAVASNIYKISTPSGRIVEPPAGRSWSLSKNAFFERLADNRIWFGATGNNIPSIKRFKSELKKDGITPMTIWKHGEVGHSQDATKRLKELFDDKLFFDYPKPVELVKRALSLYTSGDDIILDFFSGSATTAHAVMQLNAEDGGARKFILVQLPEQTDEKSEAFKAGYKNICEIGKERIRRAGAKIKAESGMFQTGIDTGFKVFKLDTSNLKTWDATPVDKHDARQMDLLLDRMNDMIDTIKNDRTDLDIAYEVILKVGGVDLTDPMTAVEVDGKRAYTIGANEEMLLCLQPGLTAPIIEKMAEQFTPAKMILSEKCFADDTAMANAHYILKEREIELKLV